MRVHQIMTRRVVTAKADTPILEAANLMLRQHISGLPVVGDTGKLIGIVSEGDFIRRGEIGTQRKRGRWLRILLGPDLSASDFVNEHGRRVGEIMTPAVDLCTATEDMLLENAVHLMERRSVRRLPVVNEDALVGIVTRSDFLRAVASLARDVPDPTADDDRIRERVIAAIENSEWQPLRLGVIVRDGVAHLSGVITDERFRKAIIVVAENVSGVKLVHDHICLFDALSGVSFRSPEDEEWAKTA